MGGSGSISTITWASTRRPDTLTNGCQRPGHRWLLCPWGHAQEHWAYYDVAPDGRQDVYLTSSKDGGRTFGLPRRISDAPSEEDILFPAFADARLGLVATDQRFSAAWPDTRRG